MLQDFIQSRDYKTIANNRFEFSMFPKWNFCCINPIPPGLLGGGAAWGGGGGAESTTAYNSKTINDNKMKLGGVVKDH